MVPGENLSNASHLVTCYKWNSNNLLWDYLETKCHFFWKKFLSVSKGLIKQRLCNIIKVMSRIRAILGTCLRH